MVHDGKHDSLPVFGNLLIIPIDPGVKLLWATQSWQLHFFRGGRILSMGDFQCDLPRGWGNLNEDSKIWADEARQVPDNWLLCRLFCWCPDTCWCKVTSSFLSSFIWTSQAFFWYDNDYWIALFCLQKLGASRVPFELHISGFFLFSRWNIFSMFGKTTKTLWPVWMWCHSSFLYTMDHIWRSSHTCSPVKICTDSP